MSLFTTAKARLPDNGWRLLARALEPRLLLVLLCVLLFTLPAFVARPAQWLDHRLFALGAWLKPAKLDASQYVRVSLPDDEVQRLLRDPLQAQNSLSFLYELQQTSTQAALLLLPQPLWREYRTNELLRMYAPAIQAAAPTAVAAQLTAVNQALRHYMALLGDTSILKAYHAPQQPRTTSLWALLLGSESVTALSPLTGGSLEDGYPLYVDRSLERPLLWQTERGAWPDARLALVMAKIGVKQIQWLPQQGVQLQGQHLLSTAANSSLIPLYSQDSGKSFTVTHYQLSDFNGREVRRMLQQKVVVVAAESDTNADDLLQSVASVTAGEYLNYSPWFFALHIILMLFLLCYLLLLFNIPTRMALIVSALLSLSLVLLQQALLLLQRDWLPVGHLLLFLWCGHALMFLLIVRRRFYTAMDFEKTMTLMSAANTQTISAPRRGVERREPVINGESAQAVPVGNGQRIGRYEILRELGRGAMGVVYQGYDPGIARFVAIKKLKIDSDNEQDAHQVLERFKAEAGAAGKMSHPNIVTIFELGEAADGSAFIAMDFVDGLPLSAHTKPETLLDVRIVLWLMAQVADAVGYAHRQGIVHRDIKPSNILFDAAKREVKVADFGIAKALDDAGQTRTRTGDILGSPLYMSPEQIQGGRVTAASDIFSLGVTLYQLLTGELPFSGDNLPLLSMQIVKSAPRPLSEIRNNLPRGLQTIIKKSLQKNPENRYRSAEEMADALKKLLQTTKFS